MCRVARQGSIRLHRFVRVDSLTALERETLGPALYAIFCDSYGELSRETMLDEIVFKSGAYLGLFHDTRGAGSRVVGFSVIKASELEVGRRRCLDFAGSVYFLPGYRGGRAAGRLALTFAMIHKLRHPLRPVVYGLEMLSPVSYQSVARTFAQIYPHRELRTPPRLQAIADAIIDQRGLLRVEGEPNLVHYPDPARHERVVPQSFQCHEPDARFYVQTNPNYRAGSILFSIVPLTLVNIIGSATSVSKRWLRLGLTKLGQTRRGGAEG